MIRLQAEALDVTRGGRQILRQMHLDCSGGEFIALIGPNGSGKSTLLATLAGLLHADSGSVRLDDQRITDIAPRTLARRRAYLPQNARCEWPLPVERMVALGLVPTAPRLRMTDAAEAARIETVLADCDLLAQRSQPVTTLSGGELARAMLARALIADPQLLIVDEPLAGLDPRHAWDAARRLRQLAVEQGKLVIAALHDLNIALRCATRVWALKGGRLVADGLPGATISAQVLRELFEIQASVSDGPRPFVDFAP
ncbi:MAG: ABC transporter ATP-binding protein [Pseudomonadota bacterium]